MTYRVLPLAELASVQGGIQKQPKRTPNKNPHPFLRVANVTAHGLDLREVHSVEVFDGELDRYRLQRGDLLVVEGNGSASQIGRAAVWDGSITSAVHQNHLIRIRPGPQLDPRYLGLIWNAPTIRRRLSNLASSSNGLHTLSVAKLKRVEVPVPSIAEQHHIVDLLETHLSHLDSANASLLSAQRRGVVLSGHLLDSQLKTAPTDRAALTELLAAPLSNGKSVPSKVGGFPVLRLTSLKRGRIDLTERKEGAWSADDARRFRVERGDFLISRGNGSLTLVGRGGLVDLDPDPVAYPDTLIRARPDTRRVIPEYLALVWNAPIVRRQLEASARTTAGIYKINQKDLSAIQLPIPSLFDQLRIVESVASSRKSLATLSDGVDRARRQSAALRRTLLAAAFSGRLTGHDSDLSVAQAMLGS